MTTEKRDVICQKVFSALSLDSCFCVMRSSLGSQTMGLYKNGVLKESKEVQFSLVQLSLVMFYAWVHES